MCDKPKPNYIEFPFKVDPEAPTFTLEEVEWMKWPTFSEQDLEAFKPCDLEEEFRKHYLGEWK